MSTTVIYEETVGNAVIKLRVEEKPNGPCLIETINGGVSNTLFIPERHRAAVAAALCPPAPGEVTEDRRLLDWVRLNYPEVIDAYDEDRDAAAPEESR